MKVERTQNDILDTMKCQVEDLNQGIAYLEKMSDAEKAGLREIKELIVATVSEFNDRYAKESLVFYDEMSEQSDVADAIYRLFNAQLMYSDYRDRLDMVMDEDASYAPDYAMGFHGELEMVLSGATIDEDYKNIAFIVFQLQDVGNSGENKLEVSDTCFIGLKKDGSENDIIRVEYCW